MAELRHLNETVYTLEDFFIMNEMLAVKYKNELLANEASKEK
jgi:hypothetical protein